MDLGRYRVSVRAFRSPVSDPSIEGGVGPALEPTPVNNSDRTVHMVSIIGILLAEVTVSVRTLKKLAALAAQ